MREDFKREELKEVEGRTQHDEFKLRWAISSLNSELFLTLIE
jgi:hypothetical protein